MERFLPRAAVLLAAVLVLACAPAVFAQDEDDEEAAPADTTETEGPSRAGGGVFASGFGTLLRPTYKLAYKRDQDSSTWDHDFSLRYPISDRISFQASSLITVRETDALNRENRQERWNAGLGVRVTSAVDMAVKLDRTKQTDVRNQGSSSEVRSFREKETADFSTSYSKTLLSGLETGFGVNAGFERNQYSDVSSRGSVQGVRASLGYSPTPGLQGSFNYSGKHSLLDSEQGTLRSTDESYGHTLGADVDYTWGQNTLKVSMGRSTSANEYPKDERKERREQESQNTDVTATFKPVPGMDLSLGYGYTREKSSYALDPGKDSDVLDRSVTASVGYTLAGVRLSGQLSSDTKRNEYYNEQTGDSYGNTLSMTAARDFGERLKTNFSGRMTLYSHHFDDTEENDQDRDLYDREGTLRLEYLPVPDITAALTLRVREDQLIYIRTTRTGDNKTSQTYSVQPSITKRFSPSLSVTQRYELSADYTFYTYNESKNFLVRNLGITTELTWSGFTSLDVTLSHRYQSQDEGSYVTGSDGVERYSKNSERDDHTMKIGIKYKLFGVIGLEASQDFTVQQKWNQDDDEMHLTWERHDTRLTGKAAADYEFPGGTKLKVSVERTERDATTIVESQRHVWDIAVNIEKPF